MSRASRQQRARARARAGVPRLVAVALGTVLFGIAAFVLLRPGESVGAPDTSVVYAAPVLGDANAKVAIVEYGDFQCPSCAAFARAIEPQLVAQYLNTGKAKLVFKHFAWIGEESRRAANAASCAGAQGRFWEYHDLLYTTQRGENTGFFSAETLKRFASQLGLDRSAFDPCVDRGTYRSAVERDTQEARNQRFTGTPTFLVNGERVVPTSFSAFASIIEAKLRQP